MISNFFNFLLVFAAIEAHSIKTYHSNFVDNHDRFDTQEMKQILDDQQKRLREIADDAEATGKRRRFKIRLNLPSRSF